ncbi:MAG: hypothetical protein QXZ63_08165 [Sulfolobales archaeon]
MGVGLWELKEELEEDSQDEVRTAFWDKILGFKDIFATSSLLEVKEPALRCEALIEEAVFLKYR